VHYVILDTETAGLYTVNGDKPPQTLRNCYVDNSKDEKGSLQSGDGCMGNTSCSQSIQALVGEAYYGLECLYEGKIPQGSILTGFTDLDVLIGGLHSGDLIVVGARPCMGKTALAVKMICNIEFRNHDKPHVAIFSLEMSAKQWVTRMLFTEAKVTMNKLNTGKFTSTDWKNFSRASKLIAEANVQIYGNSYTNINRIIDQCQILNEGSGLDLVVIDNGAMMLEEVSAALKALAEELSLPIVVYSQLSRCLEDRQDKMPILSDIPFFPTLEKYADVVMFLYRHEVYSQKPCHTGVVQMIIAKNRNGAVGTVPLTFDDGYL